MRKKFLGVLLLLLLSSCSASTSVSPLVGSWITSTTEVTYSSDGTFTEKVTDSSLTVIQRVNGTYSTSGTTLTLIATTADPTVSGLPRTTVYEYVLDGNSLTLTASNGVAIRYTKRV